MTIYSLINLKAELTFDLPSKNDSTIFLAVQAADIRRDNKEILGDYVFKGKQLSTGKEKLDIVPSLMAMYHWEFL